MHSESHWIFKLEGNVFSKPKFRNCLLEEKTAHWSALKLTFKEQDFKSNTFVDLFPSVVIKGLEMAHLKKINKKRPVPTQAREFFWVGHRPQRSHRHERESPHLVSLPGRVWHAAPTSSCEKAGPCLAEALSHLSHTFQEHTSGGIPAPCANSTILKQTQQNLH